MKVRNSTKGKSSGPAVKQKRFGTYLRKVREERRLSLDAVEEMSLGLTERVTKSHLSRIENGQAIPTFPRMFTLSQIYGIPVSFLAERFEISLKQGMFPRDIASRPVDEIRAEALALRRSGRHAEALLLYEALLERPDEVPVVEIRLECINCLTKLSREATAKEECEKLLSSPALSTEQLIVALHYFAMCCYRLGKFTVAMMAIDRAEGELPGLEKPERLSAHLGALKGNLLYITRRHGEAAEAFVRAYQMFEKLPDKFEACRTRLNVASSLIEAGSHARAKNHIIAALTQAEAAGYDRQQAFALSHLARLAFKEGNLESAESYCLRSNRIARSREYAPILFRNCFYLWQIARTRRDDTGVRTNERTLRTYLGRVDGYLAEAAEFSAFLSGGRGDE